MPGLGVVTAGTISTVRVAILGPLEVHDDGGAPVAVAGARLRSLIARLALAGGQPVSTGALAEAVWDCALPADVANALQTLVSRARRALGGAAAVEQSAAGYRLAVTPDDVDALRFERLVAEGAVAEALALWRGPALADAGDFAEPFARRLEELRLDATVTFLTRELDAGRAAARVGELEALVAEHPLHEKLAGLLMRALAATGRQADALAAYEALRTRLADELGIDPGPEAAGRSPGGAARRDSRGARARRPCPHEPAGAAHQLRRPHGRGCPGGEGAAGLPSHHPGRPRRCGQDEAGRRGRRGGAGQRDWMTRRTGSGSRNSRRSPTPPTCRRRCSARSACGNRACCPTARSGSPAATRAPGCSRGWPTPAPCWSSTTASISSTRAPTWRTRCSPTAHGCGSWRPAGSRLASRESRCSSSRPWPKIPPCGCSPTGRRRSARISRWTASPAR